MERRANNRWEGLIESEAIRLAPLLDSQTSSRFSDILRREFSPYHLADYTDFLGQNIWVCGRNGVGKSLFIDHFRHSPLFSGIFEADFDKFAAYGGNKQPHNLVNALSLAALNLLGATKLPHILPSILVDERALPNGAIRHHSVSHILYCSYQTAHGRLMQRDKSEDHPVRSSSAAYMTQAPYIMSPGTFVHPCGQAILWDLSTHGSLVPMATIGRNACGQFDVEVHNADKLAVFGHCPRTLALTCHLSYAHAETTKPMWDALLEEMDDTSGNLGGEAPRFLPRFNERFDTPFYLERLRWMAGLYPDRKKQFEGLFADCAALLSGCSVDGVSVRGVDNMSKLPDLSLLRPWQDQEDNLSAYARFFVRRQRRHPVAGAKMCQM